MVDSEQGLLLLVEDESVNLREVVYLFDVVVVRCWILVWYFVVVHVQGSCIARAEASIRAQLWIERNLVLNQVGCHVLESDGQIVLTIDPVNPVEQIYQFTDELLPIMQVGIFEDLLHDFDELVQICFLLRQHLKVLRYLEQLDRIQIVDEVDFVCYKFKNDKF